MTLAADAKKVAAQFSKAAKVQQLTAQLRDTYGTTINRKQLKAYEKAHKLVVQWVARREEPSQGFRTPLGFVRSGRGEYAIPAATAREEVLVNELNEPVTVTEVPGGPGRDVREVTAPITVEVEDSIQGYADRERGVTGVNAQVERGFRD
mgnify:CR=1 FL=1